MAHRQFTDPKGLDWIAYDVVPRAEERRAENRRGEDGGPPPDPVDRRGEVDRRVTVGGTRPVRLTQGWVCFEREGERRRLQPIPQNWHLQPDAELCKLLELARLTPQRARVDVSAVKTQR